MDRRDSLLAFLTIAFALVLNVSPADAQLIVIDPGHGGRDPGAVGCGLEEEDIVLDVSLKLQSLLQRAGVSVRMTRSNDTFVTLTGRSDFANSLGASRFVSIHSNASTPAATGTETFSHTTGSSTSRNLRDNLQSEMIAAWGLRDRGGKTANFSVLRRTSMPAALTELAFTNRCDPDARLLGSAAARTDAAEAHFRAIMRHLGRSTDIPGGSEPTPPAPTPPPSSGSGGLIGVVFEDIGVGFEDTTRRLAGARVTIRGGSASASSNSTGTFAMDSAAGPQTIEVSLAGYVTGSRTCTVAASSDRTWCSIGLRKVIVPAGDSCTHTFGGTYANSACSNSYFCDDGSWRLRRSSDTCLCVEATGRRGCTGPAVDGPEPTEPEPTEPEPTEPEPTEPEPTEPAPAPEPTESPMIDPTGSTLSSGCSVSTRSSSNAGWALLGLLALVGFRRRRAGRALRRAGVVTVAMLALVACDDVEPVSATESLVDPSEMIELPREVAATASLTDIRTIAHGAYQGATVSPTGEHVALSHDHLGGLSLVELSTNTLTDIATGRNVGLHPVWSRDGARLGYRSPDQSFSATPTHAIALDGSNASPVGGGPVRVFAENEAIVVVDTMLKSREVYAPAGDRYFAPELSPDGRFVSFRGLSTGLYLVRRADGKIFHLGGEHLSFDPSGQYLVFEQIEDNGHEVLASDLYLTDLNSEFLDTARLTDTEEIERSPSLANGTLVFQVDREIRVATLAQ